MTLNFKRMSLTKAALNSGRTSVEKTTDYDFSGREFYAKRLPAFDTGDIEGVLEAVKDTIDSLIDQTESKDKIERLQNLHKRIAYFYKIYDDIDIDTSKYTLESQQKYFYEVLMEALQIKNLVAIPDKLGDYNGFRLYSSRPIGKLKGLNMDPKVDRVLEPFPTELQCEIAGFLNNAFIGMLKYPEFYTDPDFFCHIEKKWQKFVFPLMNPTNGFKNTHLYSQVERQVNSTVDHGVEDWRRAIDMRPDYPHNPKPWNVPLAIVPMESWFPAKVKKLKATDIFALLPPKELEVLQLILGRAMVGPSGSKPCGYDEPIKHNHRTAAILLGRPGTGKSELLDLINNCMSHFGFLVQPFRSMDERFGLGEIACADLIYKDDGSDDEMTKLCHSSHFKTYATGGMLCAEKKNRDATYKRARGAAILASNAFNPNNAYDADDGIQSRLRLLETIDATSRDRLLDSLPENHMWKGAKSLGPLHLIRHLASNLKVDPMVIMAWFLRLCANKFYRAIPNLPEIDKTLESGLQNRIPADPLYITVKALKFILVLQKQDADARLTAAVLHDSLVGLTKFMHDYRSYAALTKLKEDWEEKGRQPEHLWSAVRELQYEGLKRASDESADWMTRGGSSKVSAPALEAYVKQIFTNLVTWGSIKINPSPAQLMVKWNSIPSSDLSMIADKVRKLTPKKIFSEDDRSAWLWYQPTMKPDTVREARKKVYENAKQRLEIMGISEESL